MSGAVLDTSVFIARESGRPLRNQPALDDLRVTVITLAELEAGVLAAKTPDDRAARLATLQSLANLAAIPVDDKAAHEWALLRVKLAQAGRKVNANDLWIAAIAAANGLPVVTQDDDFDAIETVGGPAVVKI